MAKKKAESPQTGFAFHSLAKAEPRVEAPEAKRTEDDPTYPATPLDAQERPKLRLVHSVEDLDVVVEPNEDNETAWLTFVKPDGSSRQMCLVSVSHLERLRARIPVALKLMGRS